MSEWLIIPKQLLFCPQEQNVLGWSRMAVVGGEGPGFRELQAEARCLATGESPEFR